MPFFRLFEEKKYSKAIFIPAVLLLRAMALFFGIVFGLVNEFANSTESDC
jgi:hypothetical protein